MAYSSSYVIDGLLSPGTLKIGGTDIGYSEGGIQINTTEDRQKFYSHMVRSSIKEKRREMDWEITINFAEVKIDTLQFALGQTSSNKSGSTALILDDTEPSSTTLEFVVVFDDAPNMKFYFHKVEYLAGGGFSLQRGQHATPSVTFKAKASDTGSKFGYIYHGVGIS